MTRSRSVFVTLLTAAAVVAVHGSVRSSAATTAKPRAVTLARAARSIESFAQRGDRIAWTEYGPKREGCERTRFARVRGRDATVSSRRLRACPLDSSAQNLFLAGATAFFTSSGGSNLTYYLELWRALARDRSFRHRDEQTIDNSSLDVLVQPATDGRDLYFWSQPEVGGSNSIVRYDGAHRKRLTKVLDGPRALAAGDGRFAFAPSDRHYDCAHDPSWSPDGHTIVYASYNQSMPFFSGRQCKEGIWLVDTADGSSRRIAAAGRSPDWSPDGTQIAYERESALVVMHADGSLPRTVGLGRHPNWSPNGALLAFDAGAAVHVAGLDGSGERLVADNATDADWAPDGRQLVVARPSGGLDIVSADGSTRRRLTLGADSEPAWSPDGARIAFVRCPLDSPASCLEGTLGGFSYIAKVAPDGPDPAISYGLQELVSGSPSWSPDSKHSASTKSWSYLDSGDSHIWIDTQKKPLTSTAPPVTPVVVRSRLGKPLARFQPGGEVVDLAVTRALTAAVTREGSRVQVEVLAPRRLTVPLERKPTAFEAFGSTLVIAHRRDVYAFDTRDGIARLVARAAARPIGLSIVGRRIAWAENVHGHGRIRAVFLQR